MKERTGEKVGWIGGWLGGFLWLLILSGVWLYRGQIFVAVVGAALVLLAVYCILWFAPWKHPRTKYWKLLLPIYAMFLLSVSFAIFGGGFTNGHLNWWSIFWLCPILTPFFTVGQRTWHQSQR